MKYVIFSNDGRIDTVYSHTRPRNIEPPAGRNVITLEGGVDIFTHYIDVETSGAQQKAEPSFAFNKATIDADGIDTATISGLPAHTLVTWPDGEVTEINDGLLEFAVDLAGTYTFIIDAVQYTKQEVTIEALA